MRKKSFTSCSKSKYWSEDNKINPRYVFKSCGKKYKFDCKCGHLFQIDPNSIIYRNSWCPYCSNPPLKLCNNENCVSCYEKSFASHKKVKYWSTENKINPRTVFKFTSTKYKFDCPNCNNIYISALCHVSNGKWCICTKNKTETILYNFLTTKCDSEINKQKKFNWCKKKLCLPFDFFISDLKLLIELDGRQHFEQVQNWPSPEKTQKNDQYKMKLANKRGYSIIRIPQQDVWNDKNNWKNKLLKAIKKYKKPTNIFIGNIYSTIPYDFDNITFID